MPYTTQGFMTAADIDDYRYQTDMGATTIDMDDPPEWFDVSGSCPVCAKTVESHEAFRVTDAGGTIFACLGGIPGDLWRSLPDDQPTYWGD